ncbi:unnamed protein product [Meganyctiphanes norvegica]|uniref:Uncharacterized protein n=1 Tax=Meganyctiphanes norvegica TaxID=48144 RepID=A0AAV2S379_MEGNR
MFKSCSLVLVAILGFASSIVGASQLAIVVIYYSGLPPIFMFLSLVTGTFVITVSSCIIGSIITMIRTSVNMSGKIGVNLALGSMCIITSFDLLLLLLQCHWILDQKVLTDIGPFQLQCIKSMTDISEGVLLLILTNSTTLCISTIALLQTCFWKVRNHADVLQTSVLSSNWVYENSSDYINNVTDRDITISDHDFKQSRRFGNTHVQLPKIHFKTTRKGSVSSNNQLLRNISSYSMEYPEQPHHTFADVVAVVSPQSFKRSEKALIRLTSFGPTGEKEKSEHLYEDPFISPEKESSESNGTESNSSTLKCSYPLKYPNASMNRNYQNLLSKSDSEDICHWLKKGKWRNHSEQRTPGIKIRTPCTPGYTPPPWINSNTDNKSESDNPIGTSTHSTYELVTPSKVYVNIPRIKITPPNEKLTTDINAAIHSLDSVLHLTPSVSTASYRNSNSPQSAGSSPM